MMVLILIIMINFKIRLESNGCIYFPSLMSESTTDWLLSMLFSSIEADMIPRLGCCSLFLPPGNFQMI